MNVAKGRANVMAYLVCQGQQEVVEEDGSDCNPIILVVVPHKESQNR